MEDQTDGSLKQSTGSSSVAGAACINVVRKNRILDCDNIVIQCIFAPVSSACSMFWFCKLVCISNSFVLSVLSCELK